MAIRSAPKPMALRAAVGGALASLARGLAKGRLPTPAVAITVEARPRRAIAPVPLTGAAVRYRSSPSYSGGGSYGGNRTTPSYRSSPAYGGGSAYRSSPSYSGDSSYGGKPPDAELSVQSVLRRRQCIPVSPAFSRNGGGYGGNRPAQSYR